MPQVAEVQATHSTSHARYMLRNTWHGMLLALIDMTNMCVAGVAQLAHLMQLTMMDGATVLTHYAYLMLARILRRTLQRQE